MSKTKEVIKKEAGKIMEQQNYRKIEINDDSSLVNDLGLSSLDIAQLIASLEMELNKDPFEDGASLANIKTINDLDNLYR